MDAGGADALTQDDGDVGGNEHIPDDDQQNACDPDNGSNFSIACKSQVRIGHPAQTKLCDIIIAGLQA